MRHDRYLLMGLLCLLPISCKTPGSTQLLQESDDRMTAANNALVDVAKKVNLLMNRQIASARLEVNPQAKPWDDTLKMQFIDLFARRVAGLRPGTGLGIHWFGANLEFSKLTEIEVAIDAALTESAHEIHHTKFIDSRYGENPLGVTQALTMAHVSMAIADRSIAPTIRLGSVLVGVDKIGHFAEEGYWYFLAERRQQLHGQAERWQFGQFMEGDSDLNTALHKRYQTVFGSFCELCVTFGGFGYYGTEATGVCSFADMHANESGFEFFTALYADPDGYMFNILKFDVSKWNEEISKNKYVTGLIVRPDREDGL